MMCRCSLVTLFLLLTVICNAQDSTSRWTWMSGDVTIPEYAIYGQRGIPSKDNTPGPRFESCKWTDKKGRLWVFGGQSMDEFQNRLVLNDLWVYDPATDEWTWISGDSTNLSPAVFGVKGIPDSKNHPASMSSAAYWTDKDGNFWLYQNNLWKYDPVAYQWTWVSGDSSQADIAAVFGTIGVPGNNNTPGTWFCTGNWIDKDGNFWFYDQSPLATKDALWKYDPAVNMWTCVRTDSLTGRPVYGSKGVAASANTPAPRLNNKTFTDGDGNLWLFGGLISQPTRWPSGFYNDLWKYNIQTNQWMWVNGDSVIDVVDRFGPQGIPSDLNKPGGNTAANAWVDKAGNFWFLGGSGNYNTPLSVFWKYDPSSDLWTWISSGSSVYGEQGKSAIKNYPGARYSGLTWTDTAGNFWLFGGNRNSSYTSVGVYSIGDLFNDLWKYDLSTGMWTWMKGGNSGNDPTEYGNKGVPAVRNNPGARSGGTTWVDASDNLWLFGGSRNAGRNDLWKYDPFANTWTWVMGDSVAYPPNGAGIFGTRGMPAATNVPPMRTGSNGWKDRDGNFWMYGGMSPQPFYNSLNDLWKFDPVTGMWTWMDGEKTVDALPVFGIKGIPAAENTPGSLYQAATWIDKSGNLWLFGGSSTSKGFLNDLWKYNISSGKWTWIQGDDTTYAIGKYGKKGVPSSSNRPGARVASVYWTDHSGNFWLFGGQAAVMGTEGLWVAADLNDMWKYDPVTNKWTWINGDSTSIVNGVWTTVVPKFGEKGVESSLNSPGALALNESNGSWTDINGNLWLSQGGTLWRFNPNTNQWAWMDGDSSYMTMASYGTQGIPSASHSPGSRYSSLSWTDSKGNFWLYSGNTIAKSILVDYEDLWRFTPPISLISNDSIPGDTIIGDSTTLPASIKVYPNPFRNILSVSSSQKDSVSIIKAYSISGALLLQINTKSLKTDIDMSSFPAGAYIIVAEDGSHRKVGQKTVIKQ